MKKVEKIKRLEAPQSKIFIWLIVLVGAIFIITINLNSVMANNLNGIYAYYPFNNGYNDTGTWRHNLTINGNVPINTSTVTDYQINSTSFYSNKSNFPGYDITGNDYPNQTQGTYQAWIKLNDMATNNAIVSHSTISSFANNLFWTQNDTIGCQISRLPNNVNAIYYNASLKKDIWYQLACSWNATGMNLFFNGALVNTTSKSASDYAGSYAEVNYFCIGVQCPYISDQSSNSFGFNGSIDEVKIFNVTVPTSSINSDYTEFRLQYEIAITENSQSYNATTYESSAESFIVNFTYDNSYYTSTTANLIYNGTSYTGTKYGTGNTIRFERGISIPLTGTTASVQNKSFYWEIKLTNSTGSITYTNATLNNQTVDPLQFNLCNATNNIAFVNFTFKDEASLTNINGTIPSSTWYYWIKDGSASLNRTFSFINTSMNNPSYSFCFKPVQKSVNIGLDFRYASTGYPQRTYTFNGNYSNSTSNTTLYLLGTADGQYVTYQIVSSADQPLDGVSVSAVRTIDGTPTEVASGTTGGDGAMTFWLNPDYTHTVTFIKSGYNTYVLTHTPTQSVYTITLSSSGTGSTNTSDYNQGITYSFLPISDMLINQTNYNFSFTLSSSYWNLDSFGFVLKNQTNGIIGSNSSTTGTGGTITLTTSTLNYTNIIMDYYWVINGSYQNATKVWSVISTGGGDQWSLLNFFRDLKNYTKGGDAGGDRGIFGMDDFSRTLIIFLIIFGVIGTISYVSGTYSPGVILIEIAALVTLFDVGLDLLPNPINAVAHFPTILSWIVLIGYGIYEWRA